MSIDNPYGLPEKFNQLKDARKAMLELPFSPKDTKNKAIEKHLDKPCELIPDGVAGGRVAYWIVGYRLILISHKNQMSIGGNYTLQISDYIEERIKKGGPK